MPVTFIPNPLVGAELAETAEMEAALLSSAEMAAEAAQALAPVLTGAYRDSIHAEAEEGEARLVADVPYAVYVEFGTVDTPAFSPLRRGAEAAGLHPTGG